MKYFLDTNIIIYAIKGTFPALSLHFRKIPSQSIVIPLVVMAEIEYGAQKSINYNATIEKYRRFTDVFPKIGLSQNATVQYGRIRKSLEKTDTPIGPNDLIIASSVLAEGGTLVTHNIKKFCRVPDLQIEDWTEV